ncbi:type VI secretion system accessory protein TagJ [Chitinilyticum litopenaei]|uniref:type VI secretion system accessory protein TagJ n=1 Tax=Chitinilyticum litopenaei TaxID=1121276 RepID=UPI00040F6D6B|nr:type VI secretion system accessory protein TagJ [Chitinilyticum litopenaei]
MTTLSPQSLADQLADIQDRVRNAPSDPQHRIALAQLLCARGQWDRAQQQLQHLQKADQAYTRFAQTYGGAIRGEQLRAQVFAGDAFPHQLAGTPAWLLRLAGALGMERQKAFAAAQQERQEACLEAPAIAGELDGQPFAWLADADPRMGPAFEAIIDGDYHWLAPEMLAEVRFFPPQTLFDLLWRQAIITTVAGEELPALIPARYPGSENGDDRHALGRATDWIECRHELWHGQGQRMLASDDADFSLLAIATLTFRATGQEAA